MSIARLLKPALSPVRGDISVEITDLKPSSSARSGIFQRFIGRTVPGPPNLLPSNSCNSRTIPFANHFLSQIFLSLKVSKTF
jgi:hypothetical protein